MRDVEDWTDALGAIAICIAGSCIGSMIVFAVYGLGAWLTEG